MHFFEVYLHPDDFEAWCVDVPHDHGEINWKYKRCQKATDVASVKLFVYEKGGSRDYQETPLGVPVFSVRLRQIVERIAPDEVQFIPVEIEAQESYFIANVLSSVECLDFEESLLDFKEDAAGKPIRVKGAVRLRVLPENAAGHHIFRIKEWPIPLIISQELATAMKTEHMTGFALSPVSP